MGYNREIYRMVKNSYNGKNVSAKEAAECRAQELRERFPDIRQIDDALTETGLKIFEVSSLDEEKRKEALENLKRDNESLLLARAECLKYHGYPADYSDVKYECPDCHDTGYIGISMCHCMRDKIIEESFKASGIGRLIKKQNFDSFDPDMQKDDGAAYENTKMVYEFCKSYAANFGTEKNGDIMNLLFIGATGLGKTHLSTSIAKRVIEKGYDVVYETAQNIFSDFEYERFGRGYVGYDIEPSRTDKYFKCDLLIIDDLGTEMTNQFTISCLYNIINTRINHEKATIINTNYSREELSKRYSSDRVISRLFGEFYVMPFIGSDVREKKIN